ncbi:MAG: protein phosphatase 2C domain-containing protein [Pseudomonadota bacterium]
MNDTTDSAHATRQGQLLPEIDGPDRLGLDIAGGRAELFCAMSPDKLSDNQDSAMVVQLDDDTAVLAVADGAGGIQGGRRASRLALVTLRDALLGAPRPVNNLRSVILNAIEMANDAVIAATRGAATTLTVVSVEGREARVFHVGDSVALITGQRTAVKLQTVAHSPVGFAIAAGFLTEEEAMYHPERHIVSNFVGTHDMIIEVGSTINMATHDSVLLASDGLADNLYMSEILAMMRRGPIDASLDELVALSQKRMQRQVLNEPGKADDLAVILFRKPD